jgi:uncharacterized protein (TIGR02145 family)
MKSFFTFSLLLLSYNSFSQSKKEQIEILTNRMDSLNRVLDSERISNQNKIIELNSAVTKLESQIAALSGNLTTLNKELQDSKDLILKKQKEIVENQRVISKLQSELKIKSDSLEILKEEQSSSHSYQVTQTGSYKTVKIGTQTWMAENLNVSTFRNGDPIPHAETNEEWEQAEEEGKPAWCYYDNDPKNGTKYGKLYNWYAVNDPRGLAPAGWHIPTDAEWKTLKNYLGDDAGKKMKSTFGWKENGNNNCGFSGLPGGLRSWDGDFYLLENDGGWWSSTEDDGIWAIYFFISYDDVKLFSRFEVKGKGFSIRCVSNL